MKNDVYPASGYPVKDLLLPFFFIALMFFTVPQALA
ncbi:MAG: hypothetical protein ACJA13_000190 [Paraglaciecola sp.]|jgi:hypothetical protein